MELVSAAAGVTGLVLWFRKHRGATAAGSAVAVPVLITDHSTASKSLTRLLSAGASNGRSSEMTTIECHSDDSGRSVCRFFPAAEQPQIRNATVSDYMAKLQSSRHIEVGRCM